VITVLRTAVVELEDYVHSAGPADNIDEFLSWVRAKGPGHSKENAELVERRGNKPNANQER
jgi:hypothetical protein